MFAQRSSLFKFPFVLDGGEMTSKSMKPSCAPREVRWSDVDEGLILISRELFTSFFALRCRLYIRVEAKGKQVRDICCADDWNLLS
jgi:hypothetical protein